MRRQVLYARLVLRVEISSVEDADSRLSVQMVIVMELSLIIRDEFFIILLAVSTFIGNFLNERIISESNFPETYVEAVLDNFLLF